MIKSYEHSLSSNKASGTISGEVIKYSKLYAIYNELPPEEKIKVQISKYNVWNIEINSIKSLHESSRINEMEKLLLEDHQNILQTEAWECRKEIDRIFQEEIPQNYLEADKILEKIKNVYISLEVTTGRRIIDFEKYINLSPVEKIRLLISQKNMIYMEQCALDRRRKSLKLDEYEMLFLNYRINFLSKCALIIHDCIIFTFYKYFKRGSPRVKEFYEEILSSGNYIGGNNKFRGKEYCRYPYDFKRPDNVPPNQWGSPNYDWNTDDHINKTKESNSSRRVKE
jgi:hypothetical protein